MNAFELFRDGRLRDAIDLQLREVHAQSTDPVARLLLAELLLFNGEFEKVREQLRQLPREIDGMNEFIQAYEALLVAEEKRQSIWIDGQPTIMGNPPPQFDFRLRALEALRRGDVGAAVDFLDEADATCPPLNGHIDGREFDGARDADDVLGTVLEVLIDDQYAWFPFESISRLRIGPLESLRDYYFVPASLKSKSGEEFDVHLPALYAGSCRHVDDMLRSGHTTDWETKDDGPVRGIGLRLVAFGEEELSFFDFTQWEA